MEKLILGFLLALLPLASYFIQYYYAKRDKKLKSFNNFLPVKVVDWVFVPFNFFLPFSVGNINNLILLFLVLCLCAGSAIFSTIWYKQHKIEKRETYLFDIQSNKILGGGIAHNIYAGIQAILISLFISSRTTNFLVLFNLFFLIIYFSFAPFSSKKIHGKFILADKIFFYLGLALIIFKLLYSLSL